MISNKTIFWYELSDWAIQELLLMMSLHDLGGKRCARDILAHVNQQGTYRHGYWQLAYALEHRLVPEGYTLRVEDCYQLNKLGRTRLRDLCELTYAMPSKAVDLTVAGFERVKELRRELQIYPFTNGRAVAKGKKIRQTRGYSVYAVLLHEDALGRRYQMINPARDSCLPCVYVGMTRLTPVERFDEHRFGAKRLRSKYVSAHGLCLMPLLYSVLNKDGMTKLEAIEMEKRLADNLREHGFGVFAGHHDYSG